MNFCIHIKQMLFGRECTCMCTVRACVFMCMCVLSWAKLGCRVWRPITVLLQWGNLIVRTWQTDMKEAFRISSICATDYHGTMVVLPCMGLILSPCALNLVLSVYQEVPRYNSLIFCLYSWLTFKIYVTALSQTPGRTQQCAWPGFRSGTHGKKTEAPVGGSSF